uniref:Uncharacterized protein n=1 Tax=Leersia perrieri TaxID=77586 RepID=A0A0D9XFC3_9ORYZ
MTKKKSAAAAAVREAEASRAVSSARVSGVATKPAAVAAKKSGAAPHAKAEASSVAAKSSHVSGAGAMKRRGGALLAEVETSIASTKSSATAAVEVKKNGTATLAKPDASRGCSVSSKRSSAAAVETKNDATTLDSIVAKGKGSSAAAKGEMKRSGGAPLFKGKGSRAAIKHFAAAAVGRGLARNAASAVAKKKTKASRAPTVAAASASTKKRIAVAQIGSVTGTQPAADAANSAAGLSIEVSAFADVEFIPFESHAEAKVLTVHQLKDAPELLRVLQSASDDRGYHIEGGGLRLVDVERLTKLDSLLNLVSDGIIPLLHNNLDLRRRARTIRRVGRLLRGYARRESSAIAVLLRRHVSPVFEGTRPRDWLLWNLQVALPSRIASMRAHRIDLARATRG